MLKSFLCAYWPFLCILWRNSYFIFCLSLQHCCVGFCHCHTTTGISHKFICSPSVLSLPPLFPSFLSRSSQNTRLGSLCYTTTYHQLIFDWVFFLLVWLILNFMRCLCILEMYPLFIGSFVDVLSYSTHYLFILFMVYFAVQKLLSLI